MPGRGVFGPGLEKWDIIAFHRSALEKAAREKIYHRFFALTTSHGLSLLPGPGRGGPALVLAISLHNSQGKITWPRFP
jgi:hypothetical protein